MRHASVCVSCRRTVLWTITEAGRRLAVDPVPESGGNAAVYRDGTGTYRSRRPSDEMPLMGWERLHKPHVATCPGQPPRAAPLRPGVLPAGVVDLSAYRRKGRGRG